jgi:hypothetical protein
MGNEVLKNGNGIEVMRVDFQFFHVLSTLKYNFDPFLVSLVMIFVVNYIIHSTTCEQAYSGARNSGFSDYACPQVGCTAEYMPGFRYILHLTLSTSKQGPHLLVKMKFKDFSRTFKDLFQYIQGPGNWKNL